MKDDIRFYQTCQRIYSFFFFYVHLFTKRVWYRQAFHCLEAVYAEMNLLILIYGWTKFCWNSSIETSEKPKWQSRINNPEKLATLNTKTQDEDKQRKIQKTICVGHPNAQDTRRRQTKQKTQHNMCWTPQCENKHK